MSGKKNGKQFVIDEEIVKEVSNALQSYIGHIDEDCATSGCMCDLRGEVCSQHISDILHNFESHLCLVSRKEEKNKMYDYMSGFTAIKCQKCGAVCAVGQINPKTRLCTDCDKEYEPAEWWWMDWTLKEC